jgi:hypothetical protein
MSKRVRREESKPMSPVLENKNLRAKICSFLTIKDLATHTRYTSKAFHATCVDSKVLYPVLQHIVFAAFDYRLAHFPSGSPLFVVFGCCHEQLRSDCRFCPALRCINDHLIRVCNPAKSNKWLMRAVMWLLNELFVSTEVNCGRPWCHFLDCQLGDLSEMLGVAHDDLVVHDAFYSNLLSP